MDAWEAAGWGLAGGGAAGLVQLAIEQGEEPHALWVDDVVYRQVRRSVVVL